MYVDTAYVGTFLTSFSDVGRRVYLTYGVCDLIYLFICIVLSHADTKLLKASGKELMVVIFVGIFVAFATVLLLIVQPTNATCYASKRDFFIVCMYLGIFLFAGLALFFFSATIIYSALLIKTNRVHRIFSGSRSNKPVKCTNYRWQLLFVLMLICGQVICVCLNARF